MNLDQITKLVWDTPENEWNVNEDDGVFTCARDLNVRLVVEQEIFDESHKFQEPWAVNLPDPTARKRYVDLYYGASWVKRFIFVQVDGARASIPLPNHGNPMTISAFDAKVGRIINQPNSQFDDYINRLSIQIIP